MLGFLHKLVYIHQPENRVIFLRNMWWLNEFFSSMTSKRSYARYWIDHKNVYLLTSPLINQGCHEVVVASFILLIESFVEVTGTLPSVSPLHLISIKILINQNILFFPYIHLMPANNYSNEDSKRLAKLFV